MRLVLRWSKFINVFNFHNISFFIPLIWVQILIGYCYMGYKWIFGKLVIYLKSGSQCLTQIEVQGWSLKGSEVKGSTDKQLDIGKCSNLKSFIKTDIRLLPSGYLVNSYSCFLTFQRRIHKSSVKLIMNVNICVIIFNSMETSDTHGKV